MNLLITGGCGFIGSNFVRYMLSRRKGVRIVNLDKLTYAGNRASLRDLEKNRRYTFVKGDIGRRVLLDKLFAEHKFDAVVHFAAESHVDRSISGPEVFVKTNVLGTQVLLEAAREHWDRQTKGKRFVHVSTDEVYGTLGPEGYFTETTPYAPNSPYSASKAGSDFMARAYFHTFGLPVIVTNCSNNYGPYQYPEKLIPLMITNALDNIPLPVYGDGMNVRDWLYVGDHCNALDTVLKKGVPGETYNIGGNNERHNIDIVKLVLEILNKSEGLIRFVKDRLGHDRRYAIDASKINRELDWKPETPFEDGLEDTVRWYVDNESWWRRLKNRAPQR
ncbi:MAG: dTDP-glucose 4,6-dehydratase [Chitinivibrionales bacterium]|nr:dTDP-glucose 4,6-dehydratase [Chitinivibrionales bacterium]MBD3394384.1 dTDP-glucose 4,6-dehydratase [Chitinivibrionales bacterium]